MFPFDKGENLNIERSPASSHSLIKWKKINLKCET